MSVATHHEARATLQRLAKAQRISLAALSRMIGRPPAYLARFVREGDPLVLEDADIAFLAAFFGISPRDLGGQE